jgi:small basic protein (TIGR04137 family)
VGQPKVTALSKKNDTQTQPQTPNFPMSQHRSLKGASTIAAKRNVLKRFERVELLKKRGQFKQGDKVIGLRKTKPDA